MKVWFSSSLPQSGWWSASKFNCCWKFCLFPVNGFSGHIRGETMPEMLLSIKGPPWRRETISDIQWGKSSSVKLREVLLHKFTNFVKVSESKYSKLTKENWRPYNILTITRFISTNYYQMIHNKASRTCTMPITSCQPFNSRVFTIQGFQ